MAGGNTRGEANECRVHWTYHLPVAEVAGTFAPTIGTGVFHGEIHIQELWSTDEDMMVLTKPGAGGDLAVSTITFAGKDTGVPTTRTYTVTARLNEAEVQWRAGQFVVATVRGGEITSLTDGTTTFP